MKSLRQLIFMIRQDWALTPPAASVHDPWRDQPGAQVRCSMKRVRHWVRRELKNLAHASF